MFDVSFSELMVIGVIALIVLGPERLPKVARTIGHLLGRAQRYVNEVKSDIQKEMDLKELGDIKHQMEDAARSVASSMTESADSLKSAIEAPTKELKDSLAEARDALDVKSLTQPATPAAGDAASSDAKGAPAALTEPAEPARAIPAADPATATPPTESVTTAPSTEPVTTTPAAEPKATPPAAPAEASAAQAADTPAPDILKTPVSTAQSVPAPTESSH